MSEYLVCDMCPGDITLKFGDSFKIVAEEDTLTEAIEKAKAYCLKHDCKCALYIFKHTGGGIYEHTVRC